MPVGRKAGSAGGFDLLYRGEVHYISPRGSSELGTLTNFELEESYIGLRQNLLALNCGLFLAEFTADMLEDLDPHPELFDLFVNTLRDLLDGKEPERVILNYERFLMSNTGHRPITDGCCLCGGEIDDIDKPYFSSSSGGVVCDGCSPGVEEKRLTERAVVEMLTSGKLPEVNRTDIIIKAHGLLCYHKRAITGRPGKMMGFLNNLLLGKMGRGSS